MRVYKEISLSDFEGWGGAEDALLELENANLLSDAEDLIKELYPNGVDETELNDIFRFDADFIYSAVGFTANKNGDS